jgi:hypothetical protein
MADRLDVPNDRQDVGRKLRRLRPAGRAHALHGASGGVRRALAASCQDVDAELLANGMSVATNSTPDHMRVATKPACARGDPASQ